MWGIIPAGVLIFLVLGTIMLGLATPTEAGALGTVGAIILAVLRNTQMQKMDRLAYIAGIVATAGCLIASFTIGMKTLPFRASFTVLFASIIWLCWRAWQDKPLHDLIVEGMRATMRITSMVAFIVVGATCFSIVFAGVDGNLWVEHGLTSLPGGVWGFLIAVNLLVFFLAFFLDFFEIAFIIVPMLAPVAQKLLTPVVGPDAALIWFGVMLCVNMQTSFMHPPFGFALFYLRSVIPKSISSADIYWGAIPWVVLQLVMVAIVIFMPITVTFFLDKPHGIDPSTVKIESAPPSEEDDLPPPSFGPPR